MQLIILILGVAFLNALRGSGLLPGSKFIFVAGSALVTYLYTKDYILTGIIFVGFYTWIIPGWGEGLISITGNAGFHDPKENPWIQKLIPLDVHKHPKLYGMAYMCLRGGIMLAPLIIAIALYTRNYAFLITLILGFCQGIIYLIAGFISMKHGVRIAEFIMGGLLGWLIILVKLLQR